MATINSVKILEICRVTPPLIDSLESSVKFSLPLTYFDIFWLKLYPVERIFFYEFADSTLPFFNSVILPKLKSSLSLTLLHFLPVAGNIIWPHDDAKPVIHYTPNDGVYVTVAESNAGFTRLSGNQMNEAFESHLYTPEFPVSDSKATIIAFQITLFPNQGFSLGVSSHHAVFDGKSINMFMKAWAYICKHSEIAKNPTLLAELTPLIDREIFQNPEGLDMIYLDNWLDAKLSCFKANNSRSLKGLPPATSLSLSNLVRATFPLSHEDIKKLRQKVLSQLLDYQNQTKPSIHLSTFVLSFAYTLVCIVKAKRMERNKKIGISFSADCRARLYPPLPANYFGNCISVYHIIEEVETLLEETGIAIVVEKISDKIKGLEKGILEGAKEKLANYLKSMEAGEVEVIGVAASPKFEVYGTDFGWGKPKKVEVTSIDRSSAIYMVESRDESGGVEVGLVLKKCEMEIFHSLFVNGLLNL